VDFLVLFYQDGDQRQSAFAAKVVAFEIDVEDGICAYAVDEGLEHRSRIDQFVIHLFGFRDE
jgi:hypothetical protein